MTAPYSLVDAREGEWAEFVIAIRVLEVAAIRMEEGLLDLGGTLFPYGR